MLLMMIILITTATVKNNSDSNSIFSSNIRDHSCQWKGIHHRYILFSDTHIVREAACLLLCSKLCLSRSRLPDCERPLPSESLCLTFAFYPSKFLPIHYSHSLCNQQLIPIYSFCTCPDFVGLIPLFQHHSTSALVIFSLVSN